MLIVLWKYFGSSGVSLCLIKILVLCLPSVLCEKMRYVTSFCGLIKGAKSLDLTKYSDFISSLVILIKRF